MHPTGYTNNKKNMELPLYNTKYSNESRATEDSFINGVIRFYREGYCDFFVGLCNHCNNRGNPKPLQRCGGCQLVSYCSRDCQKKDRSNHKYICKEFPVVEGKNVLHTDRPWKEHIAGLLERAAGLPQAEMIKSIFRNPRVCHTCMEPRPDCLADCECACVSYCSKRCAKTDKQHIKDCDNLGYIARTYLVFKSNLKNPINIQYVSLCESPERFMPIFNWNNVILPPNMGIESMLEYANMIDFFNSLFTERLSYAMTLLYALEALHNMRLSQHRPPLEYYTTLKIHVVTSSPLFDSLPWEAMMHQLPTLKKLKVVFIMQGKVDSLPANLVWWWSLQRCEDCKTKNRVITYSVQPMRYHMYYKSAEYTEPDAVVVYGNTQEMLASEEDSVHSEISYRNMTENQETVLVLTDLTEDLVIQGARAVNAARAVDQLVSPQINPFRGFSSKRAELDSDMAMINERHYFTCLKKK